MVDSTSDKKGAGANVPAKNLTDSKGGMSAEKYIRITGASRATATRDLQDLVVKRLSLERAPLKARFVFGERVNVLFLEMALRKCCRNPGRRSSFARSTKKLPPPPRPPPPPPHGNGRRRPGGAPFNLRPSASSADPSLLIERSYSISRVTATLLKANL